MFSGHGKDTQYMVCSRWQEPGHMSETEWRERIQAFRDDLKPSGRMA